MSDTSNVVSLFGSKPKTVVATPEEVLKDEVSQAEQVAERALFIRHMLMPFVSFICDLSLTPYIVVVASAAPGIVKANPACSINNLVTLNISADAVTKFVADDWGLTFDVRMARTAVSVAIKYADVVSVYAHETPNRMFQFI